MTGEDNYLTTADSYQNWHQVLASQLINEAFAKKAGMNESCIALGHAYEMDPQIEDSILMEIAQAELVREFFPYSPIKFMPPTRHKSGDIFFANLYDGLFNLTGAMTGQSIQLLGMLTEAIHNPFLMDRFIALQNANYIFKGASDLSNEIQFQANGKIARRARHVLENTVRLLKRIEQMGLMLAIEKGHFAHMERSREGGKGLDGVFQKDRVYFNPFLSDKAKEVKLSSSERMQEVSSQTHPKNNEKRDADRPHRDSRQRSRSSRWNRNRQRRPAASAPEGAPNDAPAEAAPATVNSSTASEEIN